MQLTNPPQVRRKLALATASLLGAVGPVAQAATADDWQVDSSVLYYSEDSRVTAIEPVIRARKEIGDDEYMTYRLVVDSLTGSSANGAIATASPQTFTSPSGNATYTTPANTTPLDPTFLDTRVALNAEWEKPLSRYLKGIFAVNASTEYDYTSLGVSATLSRDFNQRNTTLSAGLSYNLDTIEPVGGIPDGLTAMPTTTSVQKSTLGSSDDKTVADFLIGVTQVIDRKTLMQFNYTYGMDDGYLTDPYKILSVVTGPSSETLAGTPYLYENRPDSRARNALYWKTVHQFNEDVINFSYRYYWDDWGITSHTLDARYRFEMGGGHYLMPHARYYLQDKADFYNYKLVDGNIPQYASADYRLADLSTTTLGLKYGIQLANDSEFSVRAEMMTQQSEGDAPFPDVDAMILQLNYSFLF
ncbi:MAG: DUF3570 domain-containing protein [Thiohalophilus sp.]|uniref:DUF3570 domain-containing protein n=1 Tax=Thiohalophilus sp. TaxID=3028392 RepID=UPI00286FBE20|nr:DUF3570 domain-containing protein [Thiohalophilus sp.]MDR9436756.1 DUF3570 domain-containing protein [Thiohalophilus sp.]